VKKFTPIIILLLVFVLPVMQVSSAYSVESTAQDIALAFIENVLPIDISQYNVTFTKYHKTELPSFLSNGYSSEAVTCTFESEESVFDMHFNFENNVLTFCFVSIYEGSIISDRPYANLIEAVKGFLEKYQTYTGDDLEEMKRMLNYADATKNMTLLSGNIELTVSDVKMGNGASSSWGIVDHTSFSWVYSINGVDYTKLEITFSNGAFFSMSDNRDLYQIGDTTVNISKEEAISIAIDYAKNNYSQVSINKDI